MLNYTLSLYLVHAGDFVGDYAQLYIQLGSTARIKTIIIALVHYKKDGIEWHIRTRSYKQQKLGTKTRNSRMSLLQKQISEAVGVKS